MKDAKDRPNPDEREALSAKVKELRQRVAILETLLVELHDQAAARQAAVNEEARLRQAYKALERSRDRYRELFDFTPVPCLGLNRGGVILTANLQAAALLGKTRQQLEGWPLHRFVARSTKRALLDHLRACRHADFSVRTELTLAIGEADPIAVEIHSHRRPGDQEAILSSLLNLTDRRQAEEERRRAAMAQAASEAKDSFIAAVSHELRTPLAPIVNLLELMKLSDDLPPSYPPLLEMMERNLWQEVRMVDDLLETSRIATHKLTLDLQDLALHPLLRVLGTDLEPQRAESQVSLSLALEAHDDRLRADPDRLRQLFGNLLRNAFKFTPAGDRVTLSTANPRAGQIEIRVHDTGVGMEPDQLPRIFQPFEQAERGYRGGLGLGLAIAKGIAEAHGGTLEAQSAGRDQGSTFVITLPLADMEGRVEQA
jgi:PAS domain S-box-containing protein